MNFQINLRRLICKNVHYSLHQYVRKCGHFCYVASKLLKPQLPFDHKNTSISILFFRCLFVLRGKIPFFRQVFYGFTKLCWNRRNTSVLKRHCFVFSIMTVTGILLAPLKLPFCSMHSLVSQRPLWKCF